MPEAYEPAVASIDDDARRLKELGYDQELERSWSGFTNFAISFSIISILAGCFTTYGQAWNNGGPIAISLGWPIICAFILIIGLCMSEILSAFPTAGGIYYWALRLGGPGWGWFTGWFNMVGLVGVVASVDYGAALFGSYTIGLFDSGYDAFSLTNIFIIYVIFLAAHTVLNLFPAHILKYWNNTSVYWHVIGPVDHRPDPALLDAARPSEPVLRVHGAHQQLRLLQRQQRRPRLLVLRPAAGLPADAVHADGVRRLRASLGGDARRVQGRRAWSLAGDLLVGRRRLDPARCSSPSPPRTSTSSTTSRPTTRMAPATWSASSPRRCRLASFKIVMVIATIGQFFCAGSGMTSASRMMFAFSRDRAVPGHRMWSKVSARTGAPVNATLLMAALCLIVALPALKGNAANIPFAFYAIVSITVIGLYIAYAIPIYLRWRMGDAFVAGPWTLGKQVPLDVPGGRGRGHHHLHLHVRCRSAPHGHSLATTASRSTTASSTTRRCWSAR